MAGEKLFGMKRFKFKVKNNWNEKEVSMLIGGNNGQIQTR
jgi:hypothetical protein